MSRPARRPVQRLAQASAVSGPVRRLGAWQVPRKLGLYRYRLGFVINPAGRGRLLFIGLNPSTASLTRRDPTVDVFVTGFAQRLGVAELEVVNLFALRSTQKAALFTARNPVGPQNDRHIADAIGEADAVLIGWGAYFNSAVRVRARVAADLISASRRSAFVTAINVDGSPCHPLYQPLDQPLEPLDDRRLVSIA